MKYSDALKYPSNLVGGKYQVIPISMGLFFLQIIHACLFSVQSDAFSLQSNLIF